MTSCSPDGGMNKGKEETSLMSDQPASHLERVQIYCMTVSLIFTLDSDLRIISTIILTDVARTTSRVTA